MRGSFGQNIELAPKALNTVFIKPFLVMLLGTRDCVNLLDMGVTFDTFVIFLGNFGAIHVDDLESISSRFWASFFVLPVSDSREIIP